MSSRTEIDSGIASPDVFLLCYSLKVNRVDTTAVSAKMVDLQVIRNGPIMNFVTKPVGQDGNSAYFEMSIACTLNGAVPLPATRRSEVADLCPETCLHN